MTYIADIFNVNRYFVELVRFKLGSIRQKINFPGLASVTIKYHIQLCVGVQDFSKTKPDCNEKSKGVT